MLTKQEIEDSLYPGHYDDRAFDDISYVIQDLRGEKAACMKDVLKYFERRNRKGSRNQDLLKARNYVYRAFYGRWLPEEDCIDTDIDEPEELVEY